MKVYQNNDLFPHIEGAMIGEGKTVDLTIVGARMKQVQNAEGKKEGKVELSFRERRKTLLLNKLNLKRIIKLAGSDDTDVWEGMTITLYVEKGNWFGKKGTLAVRVAEKLPKQKAKPTKKQAKATVDALNADLLGVGNVDL